MSGARGEPLRLAILISGRGSNMAAIAGACLAAQLPARVAVVISDRPDAFGLDTASRLGLETRTVSWCGQHDRAAFESSLAAKLDACRPELIALAGFMRVLSAEFVERYPGRMLNIHPSLLPKYRGLHTHRRVLEAGDLVHGASVHFVTRELDSGPVVLQSRVDVLRGDSESDLAARVRATEHIIYPRVIGWIAERRLEWRAGRPWLDGKPLDTPIVEDFSSHARP